MASMRTAAWSHTALAAYLWLIAAIPLGNWNRQAGERLVPALLHGRRIAPGDFAELLLITLPAVLCWVAYRRRSIWLAAMTLAIDGFWLTMQIQAWWIPYVLGTSREWQIKYALGPTTKILPSFGQHVAPDGMHLVIHVLLIAAMVTTISGVRQVRHVAITRKMVRSR